MKIKLMNSLWIFILLLNIGSFCDGAPVAHKRSKEDPWGQVGQFVQSNVERQLQSNHSAPFTSMQYEAGSTPGGQTQDWTLSALFLRIQASLGIEVPWLAQLLIVPEIEFVFQRVPKS